MSEPALFLAAFPYADDVLALPVTNLDAAVDWYGKHFGLVEVERTDQPAVIMNRDKVQIGFAINGGNPENEGAAILVSDIHQARSDLEGTGLQVGSPRIDERDGKAFQVFFVTAPDGLCFYFHQEILA